MILYGAGGIAIVVLDILRTLGTTVDYCIDDDDGLKDLEGVTILPSSSLDNLRALNRGDHDMIVCIGNCDRRAELTKQYDGRFGVATHPSTTIASSVSIGEGSMIFHGSVIQARAKLGRHVIVNTAASIDHDCRIGDFVHIGPHCTLCGLVNVEDGVDIGAAATTIPGVTIGKGSIIGAGAVVLKDIPPYSVAVGVPARVIKQRSVSPTGYVKRTNNI